ncbi:hypothetical protein BV22DRAFT_971436, partial [Leucogyrophana mollusca]
MLHLLPPELWSYIFSLASGEDVVLYPALPTSFSPAAWYMHTLSQELALRTPHQALCDVQRYAKCTKRSIAATCKAWHGLGTEALMHCLFFDRFDHLTGLAAFLAADPERGRWARRLHVEFFGPGKRVDNEKYIDLLQDIIQHCPNLEIFILDWLPMGAWFGVIADALATHCHNLHTARWHATVKLAPKVIWALNKLTNLVSVQLHFSSPTSSRAAVASPSAPGEPTLGTAEPTHLTLPALQQLSIVGHAQLFIKQASGWSLPSLRYFTFDFGSGKTDVPDIVGFLAAHGARLVFLDVDSIPALDVPTILDLCPILTTFCFNLDWELPSSTSASAVAGVATTTQTQQTPAKLTNRPHPHITHIGLHGLLFAFGVGFAALAHMERPVHQRANDVNFELLASRKAFPKLESVRVLSLMVLRDWENTGGPPVGAEGWERWERWCGVCEELGVRLEDCTGAPLKDLPR